MTRAAPTPAREFSSCLGESIRRLSGSAARASPRNIAGSRPGAPPDRGRSADGRSASPVPAAVCGRGSCDASFRRRRSTFFCAPSKEDDPRLRIAKTSSHGGCRTKSGKSVCVDQASPLRCLGHRQIMPDFLDLATRTKRYDNRLRSVSIRPHLPTLNPEEPLISTAVGSTETRVSDDQRSRLCKDRGSCP